MSDAPPTPPVLPPIPAPAPAPAVLFFNVPWPRKTPSGKKILKGIFATDDRDIIDNLRRSPEVKLLAPDDPSVIHAAIGATINRGAGGNLPQALDRNAGGWREEAARKAKVHIDAFSKAQAANTAGRAAAEALSRGDVPPGAQPPRPTDAVPVMPVVPDALKLPSVPDALAVVLPIGSDPKAVMEASKPVPPPPPEPERVAKSAGQTSTETVDEARANAANEPDDAEEDADDKPADPFQFVTAPKLRAALKRAGVEFPVGAQRDELAALARAQPAGRVKV